jgi:hypothetical protein
MTVILIYKISASPGDLNHDDPDDHDLRRSITRNDRISNTVAKNLHEVLQYRDKYPSHRMNRLVKKRLPLV